MLTGLIIALIRLPGSEATAHHSGANPAKRFAANTADAPLRESATPPIFYQAPTSIWRSGIHDLGRPIPEGLDGEVRRTAPGAKLHIDHSHANAEFDLVVRGVGSYVLNNYVYELSPGTLLWLLPERRHPQVRSPKLDMWVVSIQAQLLEPEWLPVIAAQPSHTLPGEELLDLDRLLSQVAQDSDEPAAYNAGIRYAVQRAWRASVESPPTQTRPMHPAVSRALLLLRKGGVENSLAELAEEAGVAAPYLSRLLVEHTGHTFLDWRARTRLERFIEEYQPGDNLLKTSLDAGFGSYSRFHHAFIDMMGCSPSDWIKQGEAGQPRNGFDRSALPDAYATPQSTMVSARLRWSLLVPLISPSVTAALGADFLDRVLSAHSGADAPTDEMKLDGSLPEEERRHFIASLETESQALAHEYDEILGSHDIAGTYAGLLREFDLSPQSLGDAATAMAAALWTTVHRAGDPDVTSIKMLRGQTAMALEAFGPNREKAQAAHTALICHFVVLYHALQAARARVDVRAMAKLGESAVVSARRLFGQDMKGLRLDSHGLRSAPPV
jgi:AraC-like DNA-binding protein